MVRLIVCMTVYQHISLFQNSPIYQLLSVHCSNVHVTNIRNVCDYNYYTLTNVLVLYTTLSYLKHKYTVYVSTTDKRLFSPLCVSCATTNLIASEAFSLSPDFCARSFSLATHTWVCFHVVDSCATRWITADLVYSHRG